MKRLLQIDIGNHREHNMIKLIVCLYFVDLGSCEDVSQPLSARTRAQYPNLAAVGMDSEASYKSLFEKEDSWFRIFIINVSTKRLNLARSSEKVKQYCYSDFVFFVIYCSCLISLWKYIKAFQSEALVQVKVQTLKSTLQKEVGILSPPHLT